jgi:hypothetical protein
MTQTKVGAQQNKEKRLKSKVVENPTWRVHVVEKKMSKLKSKENEIHSNRIVMPFTKLMSSPEQLDLDKLQKLCNIYIAN